MIQAEQLIKPAVLQKLVKEMSGFEAQILTL
jgi:hypothetical protein